MSRIILRLTCICFLIKYSISSTTFAPGQTFWKSKATTEISTSATTNDAINRNETTSGSDILNSTVEFHTLGCWRERRDRAIPSVEEILTPLFGEYTTRTGAIEKCAEYAENQGFAVFALQRGGLCSTSPNAHNTFDYYGPSRNCSDDGKGGRFANQVYRIGPLNTEVEYTSIGCYRDTTPRAIARADRRYELLSDKHKQRVNATEKCAIVAFSLGYKVFAVQNGGWCATASDAHKTYDKYGGSTDCKDDGKGGRWANEVYAIQGWRPGVNRFEFTFESDLCSDDTSCAEEVQNYLQQYCKNVDDELCDTYNLVDFDECAYANDETEHNNCSTNANCINTFGSYTCECESSYVDLNPTIPGRHCSKNQTID